jgi:hypothetical protein
MRGKMLFEYWLEEFHLQQAGAPCDQRHGQASKAEEGATLYCASAGSRAMPVPTGVAPDALSEPLDMKPLDSLEALSEAARKVLEGLEAMSSRNDELLTATARRFMERTLVGSDLELIRRVEAARKLLDYSVKEIGEVTQIACHAYQDAFHALTDRFDGELKN